MIDSDAGTFEADGNTMLARRVREIASIARLREVSRSDECKDALGSAVASPLLVKDFFAPGQQRDRRPEGIVEVHESRGARH